MKKLSLIIFGMFIISMGLNLVSAAPANDFINGIQEAGKTVFELVRPVLEQIIGETVNGETFLVKLLFFIIIFAVVWKATSKIDFFNENIWIVWIVSIAVSVLSIRWFGNAEIVKTAILPYSALGIAISAGIPFVLFFFVVKDFSKTFKRVAWVLFAVIFIGIWFTRYDELGNYGYIYLVTAGLSVLMLWFDGTINKLLVKANLDKVGMANRFDAINDYKLKIAELPKLVIASAITNAQSDKLKKDYQKQILWLSRH